MSGAKHTPGPLVVGKVGRQVVDIDAPSGDPTLKHASWTGLIQCYGCDDSPVDGKQVAEANAARLALCWNTHDQLVEALQVAHTRMARLASILDAQRPGGVIWKDEIDQVVAALAAAGGES